MFLREEAKFKIQSAAVAEASGLAVSPSDPEFLWIINDSGSEPVLHLVGVDGTDRGQIAVEGVKNVDWEDLSSFELGGVSYLLIADTGDNNSKREEVKIHVVREPRLPKDGVVIVRSVMPAWTISFGFENGPRDCESVAVDAKAGKIILVSKRTKPPVVYEMPLRPKGAERVIARKIAEISVAPPKGVFPLPYIDQPTGLDISAHGTQAAIVTYYGVFIYSRNGKESWSEAFGKAPTLLKPHGLHQAESIAYSRDGKVLTVISEGKRSPIVRYQR